MAALAAGLALFFFPPINAIAQERTPIRVTAFNTEGNSPTLLEVARTIEDTLCLSVVIMDELQLLEGESADLEPGTVTVSGTVKLVGQSEFLLSLEAVETDGETVILELEEEAPDLFSIFTAVDRLAEGLLTALSGREIRFGSLSAVVNGYGSGGELRIDGNRVVSFPRYEDDDSYSDPRPRRFTVDRLPAGSHEIEYYQPRFEGALSLVESVEVGVGGNATVTFSAPALTYEERREILSEHYELAVAAFAEPTRWVRNLEMPSRMALHQNRSIPSPRVESDLLRWTRVRRLDNSYWYDARGGSLPSLPVTVDGDPSEWGAIVPIATNRTQVDGNLEGEGSELNSVRISGSGSSIFFLMDVKDEVSRRFTYRLYFDIDDPRWSFMQVNLSVANGTHEVKFRSRDWSGGADTSLVKVRYRVNGRFIEGEVTFREGEAERITGLNHAKIKHLSQEVANYYHAGPLTHRGEAVPRQVIPMGDFDFARTPVPMDEALTLLQDLGL